MAHLSHLIELLHTVADFILGGCDLRLHGPRARSTHTHHRTPASPDPKGRASIFGWRPANHRGAGNPNPPPPQPIPPLLPRPRRRIRRIHRVPHPPSCALCAGDAGRRGRGANILLLGAGGAISDFIGNSQLRCAWASAKVLAVEAAAGSGGVPTAIRAACPAGGGGAIWSTYQIVKNI